MEINEFNLNAMNVEKKSKRENKNKDKRSGC